MKVVILAGGRGARINEESRLRPKPMIEIGGMPILWHIMKYYSWFGHNEFIICCGYKSYVIKKYFADYHLHQSDVTFDFRKGGAHMEIRSGTGGAIEPWRVTLAETGLSTETGGRLKRVRPYIGHEPFMLTYGDGLSDADLALLLQRHRESGGAVTLTTVQPEGRYGVVELDAENKATRFKEKEWRKGDWINAGFMVMEPDIFSYLEGDGCVLERAPFEALSAEGRLRGYKHRGFWRGMDTYADKLVLEEIWAGGRAPWKIWD
ncbi:MAG: glucose-1-phosphate cytidylyltransferase [Clostridiales bacterium]|nr:glucose-1-phosphate cytidylyltransferase [Clostridiales bacterium]